MDHSLRDTDRQTDRDSGVMKCQEKGRRDGPLLSPNPATLPRESDRAWSPSLPAVARLRLQAAGTGSARQTRDAESPVFDRLLGTPWWPVFLSIQIWPLPGCCCWRRDGPGQTKGSLFFLVQTPALSWLCLLGRVGSQLCLDNCLPGRLLRLRSVAWQLYSDLLTGSCEELARDKIFVERGNAMHGR